MIPKFRVWNGKKMIDPKVTTLFLTEIPGVFLPDAPSYILMQSTGLKDKNGVEIFEGDIVKGSDYSNPFRIQLVPGDGIPQYDPLVGWGHTGVEVIGNIHQNPELLEAPNANKS